MFFRKEREFYTKYSPYEKELDDIFKWLELKRTSELPSDKDYCNKQVDFYLARLCVKYYIRNYIDGIKGIM